MCNAEKKTDEIKSQHIQESKKMANAHIIVKKSTHAVSTIELRKKKNQMSTTGPIHNIHSYPCAELKFQIKCRQRGNNDVHTTFLNSLKNTRGNSRIFFYFHSFEDE